MRANSLPLCSLQPFAADLSQLCEKHKRHRYIHKGTNGVYIEKYSKFPCVVWVLCSEIGVHFLSKCLCEMNYFLPYWWARNVTAISSFGLPYVNEGSPKRTQCLRSGRSGRCCHQIIAVELRRCKKQPFTKSALR